VVETSVLIAILLVPRKSPKSAPPIPKVIQISLRVLSTIWTVILGDRNEEGGGGIS
jgi:hypothetical protein